jgi:predicted protein tyrosine phosphatase
MPRIIVSPLSEVRETVRRKGPSHVISLLDPGSMIQTPPGILNERHLKLGVHDIAIDAPDMIAPAELHVMRLLDFIEDWDRRAPMLVHCWAGISRSTAAAFITLCRLNPQAGETDIAAEMRLRASHIQPNPLLVGYADRLMGRSGRMVAAVERLGRGTPVYEGTVWEMPADFADAAGET